MHDVRNHCLGRKDIKAGFEPVRRGEEKYQEKEPRPRLVIKPARAAG